MSDTDANTLLEVSGLHIQFNSNEVVKDLSFTLQRGRTLAIVGESGSGKSVSSLAIMGLLGYSGGSISKGSIKLFDDSKVLQLTDLDKQQYRHIRGKKISMIFQEPMTSLDPVFSIGNQIIESLKIHRNLSGSQASNEAIRLLELVHIPNAKEQLKRYPHQLSGGMRQRVMIAIALAANPKLLIADEPTTALDVTIQAQILQIIRNLQDELNMSVIFISHDMAVVSEMADDIVVMKQGEVIEAGAAIDVILNAKSSYTKELMAAVPKIGSMKGKVCPQKFDLVGTQQSQHSHPISSDKNPLVELKNVTTRFSVKSNIFGRVTHRVHAAENINLQIFPSETLALVGESGSGKSTIGKTLQQLILADSGEIYFNNINILNLDKSQRKKFKRQIQYVFQDPYGSLNPRKTIRQSLIEPMKTHGLLKNADQQVADLLKSVQLPVEFANRYPHEFSGGQRQRICIARALSCQPQLIIADEAVSALDVSVQAKVINLLMDLQAERGLAYLFISHDMAVIERVSHRVAVMYLGQIVEIGTRQQIFENPTHPYTKRLLKAVPILDPHRRPEHAIKTVDIPSPIRSVDNPPKRHNYVQMEDGHYVSENYTTFEQNNHINTSP